MIGSPILEFALRKLVQDQGASFIPPILISTTLEMVGAVSQEILKPVIIEGLILGGLGAGMLVAAYLFKDRLRG